MKINGIGNINNIQDKQQLEKRQVNTLKKEKVTPAAVFEKSKSEDKGIVYDKLSIDMLKQESDKTFLQLKKLVEEMLLKQGKSLSLLNPREVVMIDKSTRSEANDLIGPDGPLGIEAMSDKIVDFAKAISGGDKSKLAILRKAIDKGFKEAEKTLGGLPDISRKTYDRIMDKLDKWEDE